MAALKTFADHGNDPRPLVVDQVGVKHGLCHLEPVDSDPYFAVVLAVVHQPVQDLFGLLEVLQLYLVFHQLAAQKHLAVFFHVGLAFPLLHQLRFEVHGHLTALSENTVAQELIRVDFETKLADQVPQIRRHVETPYGYSAEGPLDHLSVEKDLATHLRST